VLTHPHWCSLRSPPLPALSAANDHRKVERPRRAGGQDVPRPGHLRLLSGRRGQRDEGLRPELDQDGVLRLVQEPRRRLQCVHYDSSTGPRPSKSHTPRPVSHIVGCFFSLCVSSTSRFSARAAGWSRKDVRTIFMTCTVSPFDRIRTSLMNQPTDAKIYNGFTDCLVKTVKNDGPMSLWRGFLPMCVVPRCCCCC
jgi:Mitochondrial carrier protein